MGFNTIDLALFVPTDRAVAARNWLKNNYDMKVTGRPLISVNDTDDHAPRYFGVELQATPELHATLKHLLAKPAYSTLRTLSTPAAVELVQPLAPFPIGTLIANAECVEEPTAATSTDFDSKEFDEQREG